MLRTLGSASSDKHGMTLPFATAGSVRSAPFVGKQIDAVVLWEWIYQLRDLFTLEHRRSDPSVAHPVMSQAHRSAR